jgi:hypothetical protein
VFGRVHEASALLAAVNADSSISTRSFTIRSTGRRGWGVRVDDPARSRRRLVEARQDRSPVRRCGDTRDSPGQVRSLV